VIFGEVLGIGASDTAVLLCFLMIAAKSKKTQRGRDGCNRSPVQLVMFDQRDAFQLLDTTG
jgi:hypothetical protein